MKFGNSKVVFRPGSVSANPVLLLRCILSNWPAEGRLFIFIHCQPHSDGVVFDIIPPKNLLALKHLCILCMVKIPSRKYYFCAHRKF